MDPLQDGAFQVKSICHGQVCLRWLASGRAGLQLGWIVSRPQFLGNVFVEGAYGSYGRARRISVDFRLKLLSQEVDRQSNCWFKGTMRECLIQTTTRRRVWDCQPGTKEAACVLVTVFDQSEQFVRSLAIVADL